MAQGMTIYSWNMLYRNKELERAFSFITGSGFDIFCLQEVPEEFLKRLETLPYHLASKKSVERLLEKGAFPNYNVILSRHPITATGDIPFPDYWSELPLRTRFFVRVMPSLFFAKIRNRSSLYADISISGMPLRVFNLHLVLAHPLWRLKEFETAMAERDTARPTVVCGDFNILESPHITPLNWIMGGKIRDAAFYLRERTTIEAHFMEHQLTNPLRGSVTHALSQSQLDHILLSHHLTVEQAAVIPDPHGSDHHPIKVETTDPEFSSRTSEE